MNIEDRALRDPNIQRRLPRFTGLNRFDAIGRLLHVWGLCYDARSPIALIEDVDDRSEHDGFAAAMVSAGCARDLEDGTIWVCGVEERIGYLIEAADNGRKGAETRMKQVAAGGRGKGGRFAKGPTTRPLVSDQGSTKGASDEPLEPDHTSSSSSGSSPAPDLISLAVPARDPSPPAPAPVPGELGLLVDHAVDALNVHRQAVEPGCPAIGEYDEQPARAKLLAILRRLPAEQRRPKLDHALTVLGTEARLPGGTVKFLRLAVLAGDSGWDRAQLETVASVERSVRGRDGPGGSLAIGRAPPATVDSTEAWDPKTIRPRPR